MWRTNGGKAMSRRVVHTEMECKKIMPDAVPQTTNAGLTVRFDPPGETVKVETRTTIQGAAASSGVPLEHPCGGRGICGKCRVVTDGGLSAVTEAETRLLSEEERAASMRLSCQAEVMGDLQVQLDGAGWGNDGSILTEGEGVQISVHPRCRKTFLRLTPPTLEESTDDEKRVRDALRKRNIPTQPMPPHLVAQLPERLREREFAVTVTTLDDGWISLEAGDTTDRFFGLAVDLGTTTVVVSLHDLNSGEELGRRGATNRQVTHGADVITRMSFAGEAEDGVATLQRLALDSLNPALDELCHEAGVRRDEIYQMAVVGNSVMQTLLLGIDPSPISVSPFIVASTRPQTWPTRLIGLELHPDAVAITAPMIASYVGGDIVADILASEVYESERPLLLVDVGTNAEIVLADRNRIIACASPAGPAFEGAEILQGMRAAPGAIERVRCGQEKFEIETIGDRRPVGICGSGLIDALAVLLDLGVVTENGRLLPPDMFEGPAWVHKLLQSDDEGVRIVLWQDKNDSISLTAHDIRKLQLAKGAVKVGVKILCRHRGIDVSELGGILLAGAFGSHLSEESVLRIGMVPRLPGRSIRFIGNTAWSGAKMLLLSRAAVFKAEEIRRQTAYYELSGRADFQMEYGMSMLFNDDWSDLGLED